MFDTSRQLPRRRFRTLFLSDLHLGARGCRADDILEFLKTVEADTIYLVGDILDIWHPGKVHWGAKQDAIWEDLTRRHTEGARVVYLPGNHDAALRPGGGGRLDRFECADSLTHIAADGARYLVLHGDQCDARIFRFHLMTRIGSRADAALRAVDAWLRHLRPSMERGVFELLISGVNQLMMVGNGFEQRLAALAKAGNHDGVVCGHFHKAALRESEGITYANCGDWVDSRTALVETFDGSLQLIEWQAAPEAVPTSGPMAEGITQ
ncbi:UDP-2,3-diacylglucosamine pyrophosphatase LpxH [Rhodobacter sp. JA431]|uniref:UDP-2,3-diacylglucosamine diphosphatase n=1 Tax=Rhodobacter sp. JA431 TaxID=570013 RepID=UPI000BC51904|nr:UDP-2,3-diacylglucosamine diphosphatase [Rhodobacter sp. JA431]SOC16119.1 UDP-2,3-diacylglucosamine pyrophosphatase LpxH [Rhodobacter sp. JA431]